MLQSHRCQVCGQEFTTSWALQRHLPLHKGLYPFWCELCSKGFSIKDNLRGHMASVHHIEHCMYMCTICQRKFNYRVLLMRHMKSMHKEMYVKRTNQFQTMGNNYIWIVITFQMLNCNSISNFQLFTVLSQIVFCLVEVLTKYNYIFPIQF